MSSSARRATARTWSDSRLFSAVPGLGDVVSHETVCSCALCSYLSAKDSAEVVAAEHALPTLYDVVQRWLERTPFIRIVRTRAVGRVAGQHV